MKSIFVIGAYSNTNKEDLDIYKVIDSYLETLCPEYKIITPFTIENFLNNLSNHSYEKMVSYDLDCVKKSSLLVADLTNKSTGVGIELGIAKEHNKNIIFLAKEGSSISNMVLGAFPNYKIHYYQDNKDIYNILNNEVSFFIK